MERVRVSEVLLRVSQLTAGQWGLLTSGQAEREQVPRYRLARLVDAGLLERLEQGVYAVTAAEADEHRHLRAAWLALDPEHTAEERLSDLVGSGVVSHTSAAGLYGLGDLLDDIPELTVATRRQTRRRVRLHRADLTASDVTVADGLPTTTVERTVADLLRDGQDVDHVATILGEGVRGGLVDRDVLATHLDSLARRYGRTDGQDLAEHLLDLTGQSAKALARQVAASPLGQELVTAGALSAIRHIVDSMTVDMSGVLNSLATTEVARTRDSIRALSQPALANLANAVAQVPILSPATMETITAMQAAMISPIAQELIKVSQAVTANPATVEAMARIVASMPDLSSVRRSITESRPAP